MGSRLWTRLVEGIREKLQEWKEILDTPIQPEQVLVPVPVNRRPRR